MLSALRFLGADVEKPLAGPAVQAIVEPARLERFESKHPKVFPSFELTSVFGFGVLVVVPNLFDDGKLRVVIEVVTGEVEMVVEGPPVWVFNALPVRVDS